MTTYATSRAIEKAALHDRVVVGGVDITWLRDKHTPIPPYQLMEPFGYGPSRLPLPQIDGCYEELGAGELAWARRGARVLYQRVNDAGTVVHTDYVGRVLDPVIDGASVVLNVGGEVSGPASMINEQPPRFRKMRDVGRWVWNAMTDLGLILEPWGGPDTGDDEVPDKGGMTLLARLEELGALSQDANGVQRALMPQTWGVPGKYVFEPKDTTTVDFTVYNDATRAVIRVSDSAVEAPNVIFGTGVTPGGVRIFNGRYPGIQQGTPPPYPMAGGASFGVGTTDADTLTGEGITVMYSKLGTLGYITPFAHGGVYTAAAAEAVKKLQRDADYPRTGVMDVATWNALYNLDITGYSYLDARIFPMAIDPAVQPWHYTAEGNYLARNDAFDAMELRRDRNIDYGAGWTKAQMVAHAHGLMQRSQTLKNWVGTLDLNEHGAFTGSHDGTDYATLTDADLIDYRDIRPGMNFWAPHFDGGTLFHVSGIDITPGQGAKLHIDTQARDLLEVKQIIERNAESRRDIRREWYASNRGAKPSGNMVTRDEFFGQVFNDVTLNGDEWNVIPVPMGQQGTVNRTVIRLISDPAAFAYAVFARPVTKRQLRNRIGNPLAVLGNDDVPWYQDEAKFGDWYDRRTLLAAWGDDRDTAGYWPRTRINQRTGGVSTAPITGVHIDDATYPYICGEAEQVVVYLCIYPDRDCTLPASQVFWAQEDDAV